MIENANRKQFLLKHLRNSKEVFILFSMCTRMPYVECNEETYDDQIYLFRKQEEAVEAAKQYQEEKVPVQVVKMQNAQFLSFYSSLYFIGVNAIIIDPGEKEEAIQLKELVTPPDYNKLPKGQVRVDNPEFQLTAIYLMQNLRKEKDVKVTPQIKELEEEMFRNMRKGNFIVPVKEDKQIPMMKLKDENMYQPIFSDVGDFNKFNGEKQFRPAVIPYDKLESVIVPQAKGIVINPMGIHVVLKKEQLK